MTRVNRFRVVITERDGSRSVLVETATEWDASDAFKQALEDNGSHPDIYGMPSLEAFNDPTPRWFRVIDRSTGSVVYEGDDGRRANVERDILNQCLEIEGKRQTVVVECLPDC